MPSLRENAIPRTARKPWRCLCADEIRGYRAHGEFPGGSTTVPAATAALAEQQAARMRREPALRDGTRYTTVTVIPRPNPDYRPDCTKDIQPGDRYIEYVGEAEPYASGSRYCWKCGIAVWATAPTRPTTESEVN